MTLEEKLNAGPTDVVDWSDEGPGHFVGASNCRWFKHAHVGRYCVSAVGEYTPPSGDGSVQEIGYGYLYEVMVFDHLAEPSTRWAELYFRPANNRTAATRQFKKAIEWALERVRIDSVAHIAAGI